MVFDENNVDEIDYDNIYMVNNLTLFSPICFLLHRKEFFKI